MLQLKENFQKLVPKYFNFLEKEYNFKFEGFEFDKGYAFLYIADYSNNLAKIHISFDEREGYLAIMLWPKNLPKKGNSMYRLLEVVDPPFNIHLKVTKEKLDKFRIMFKESFDKETIEIDVSQFVFDKVDLDQLLKQYAQALKKNYEAIMKELSIKQSNRF